MQGAINSLVGRKAKGNVDFLERKGSFRNENNSGGCVIQMQYAARSPAPYSAVFFAGTELLHALFRI